MVADGEITKYILNNADNKDSQGKPPYWFIGGLIFTVIALFIGSIKFIVVSFLTGSIVGVLFGYAKSRMLWKRWPYWLRGGVIGGGVTFIYALLFYSCVFSVSGYGVIGCAGFYYMWGPAFPVGLVMGYLQPVFQYSWIWSEFYGPMVAVPVWFIVGALLGAIGGAFWVLTEYIKSKKH